MKETKHVFEYDIPVNDEEQCKKLNEEYGTDYRSTEDHVFSFLDKVHELIYQVGDAGGWYIGDGIKVKVEIEYDPENK